jgi:hypothetical protein
MQSVPVISWPNLPTENLLTDNSYMQRNDLEKQASNYANPGVTDTT